MQRAAFPELQGRPRPRRHRRRERPDRVLLGLKVATFLAAGGLIGVIVLLATSGDDHPRAAQSPAVPKITPDRSGDDAPGYVPATTTPPTVIDPPALRTDTTEIAAQPAPPNPTPKRTPQQQPPRQPDFQFAVIGERCTEPGAFSLTRDRRAVMCFRRTPSEQPRWYPVF